jgi:hypothetical protein
MCTEMRAFAWRVWQHTSCTVCIGLARTICIYGILAGKITIIGSCVVYIYGSGHP